MIRTNFKVGAPPPEPISWFKPQMLLIWICNFVCYFILKYSEGTVIVHVPFRSHLPAHRDGTPVKDLH